MNTLARRKYIYGDGEYTQELKPYSSSPEESKDPSVDIFLALPRPQNVARFA
jgi:hypothetical protein